MSLLRARRCRPEKLLVKTRSGYKSTCGLTYAGDVQQSQERNGEETAAEGGHYGRDALSNRVRHLHHQLKGNRYKAILANTASDDSDVNHGQQASEITSCTQEFTQDTE